MRVFIKNCFFSYNVVTYLINSQLIKLHHVMVSTSTEYVFYYCTKSFIMSIIPASTIETASCNAVFLRRPCGRVF